MKSDHKIILQVSRKKKHFLNKLDGKYMMCAVSLFLKLQSHRIWSQCQITEKITSFVFVS